MISHVRTARVTLSMVCITMKELFPCVTCKNQRLHNGTIISLDNSTFDSILIAAIAHLKQNYYLLNSEPEQMRWERKTTSAYNFLALNAQLC